MGNCCHGEKEAELVIPKHNERPTAAQSGYQRGDDDVLDKILDDTEIGGKRGEEKLEYIERIQATYKGHKTRKEMDSIKTQKALNKAIDNLATDNPDNVNEGVQEILQKLGPFDYGKPQLDPKVQREFRPMQTLENGSKYEGQWRVGTSERDGQGI